MSDFMKQKPQNEKRKFYPDPYVAQKARELGVDLFCVEREVPEGAQCPYNHIVLASSMKAKGSTEAAELKSSLKEDLGKPFAESAAKAIMDDPNSGILHIANTRLVCKTDDPADGFDEYDAEYWFIKLTDPTSSIFKPTVHESIQNCSNTEVDGTIEVIIVFDDVYLLPLLIPFKAGGTFGMNFLDFVKEFMDAWDERPEDWFEANFENCPNAWKDEEGCHFFVVNETTGETRTLDYEEGSIDRCEIGMMNERVCSIRLIEQNVKIVNSND